MLRGGKLLRGIHFDSFVGVLVHDVTDVSSAISRGHATRLLAKLLQIL